jgi:hypothetical protein
MLLVNENRPTTDEAGNAVTINNGSDYSGKANYLFFGNNLSTNFKLTKADGSLYDELKLAWADWVKKRWDEDDPTHPWDGYEMDLADLSYRTNFIGDTQMRNKGTPVSAIKIEVDLALSQILSIGRPIGRFSSNKTFGCLQTYESSSGAYTYKTGTNPRTGATNVNVERNVKTHFGEVSYIRFNDASGIAKVEIFQTDTDIYGFSIVPTQINGTNYPNVKKVEMWGNFTGFVNNNIIIYVDVQVRKHVDLINLKGKKSGSNQEVITVNWGDNSTSQTSGGSFDNIYTLSHDYASDINFAIIKIENSIIPRVGDVIPDKTGVIKVIDGEPLSTPSFSNQTKINEVIIHEGVEALGDSFQGAIDPTANLVVNMPDSIKVVSVGTFSGSGVKEINFSENSNLLILPGWQQAIGFASFATSLTKVTLPPKLKYMGYSVFNGCSALTQIVGLENTQLIHIGNRSFYGIGEAVDGAAIELTLPATLKSIAGNDGYSGALASQAISKLTFLSVTPPVMAMQGDIRLGTQIFVPAASLNAYKTANNWSVHANNIYAIT